MFDNVQSARKRLIKFADVEFGEEDANLDYELSRESQTDPTFIRAFYDHPAVKIDDLERARKYLVLGQKGTGKTALLRRLQGDIERLGGLTHFMIFRDEVASREELDKLGNILL